MSDILEDFMEDWENVKYAIPLGILDEDIDPEFPYAGLETTLFLFWSMQKGLLTDIVSKQIDSFQQQTPLRNHENSILMMKNTIGLQLLSIHYRDVGKDFAVDYMSQTGEWKNSFYNDLSTLYPNIRTYCEIPESNEEYTKVETFLDKRLAEYQEEYENKFSDIELEKS